MTVSLASKRQKRFAEFADEPTPLDGEKRTIESILNTEVEVIGFRIGKSKYTKNQSGKYLTLQVVIDKIRCVVFTGSDVLITQVEKYKEQIPFLTTIVKINRYFTMS